MHQADAIRIFSRLKAAFPAMTLDEEQAEVLLRELALLHDPSILTEAVTTLIQREERFPAIARIRAAYRQVNETRGHRLAAIERATEPAGTAEAPEWVQVWWWQSKRTLTARQAARDLACPVTERNPVPMRDFPQLGGNAPDAYTHAEYEDIRREWVAAGSPTVTGPLPALVPVQAAA